MILVKVNIEGTVHHLVCNEMKQCPFMAGRILIAGFNLTLNSDAGQVKLTQISLRPEDVHYYSIVQPATPVDPPLTTDPGSEKAEAGEDKTVDNGTLPKKAAPKNRRGRRAATKKGGETPEA